MNNIFYTYVYMDPRKKGPFTYENYRFDFEPFYVGKGCRKQYIIHLKESKVNFKDGNQHKFNKIRSIQKEGFNPIIIKYKESLSEKESLDLEINMIMNIGRSDLKEGPLTNLTDGGEGLTGYIFKEETKKFISRLQKGRPHSEEHIQKIREALIGKPLNEETKSKISQSRKGKCLGDQNHFYNKRHTSESKIKMSISHKNLSIKTRIKMSLAKKDKPSNNKGKKQFEEFKKKTKESKLIYFSNPENRERHREIMLDYYRRKRESNV